MTDWKTGLEGVVRVPKEELLSSILMLLKAAFPNLLRYFCAVWPALKPNMTTYRNQKDTACQEKVKLVLGLLIKHMKAPSHSVMRLNS